MKRLQLVEEEDVLQIEGSCDYLN